VTTYLCTTGLAFRIFRGLTQVSEELCGRNEFAQLLIFLLDSLSWKLLFRGPHHRLCLVSPPNIYFFSHPPTPVPFSTPHITFAYAHLHILLSGRGGSMEGVHPPSPSSFAPRRSRPTIDFFCTPHRLLARTKLKSTCELHKHPQD